MKRLSDKKWFLYITEFFAGMSVMGVELAASRLLSPYFSSSQIVWTIIIGTIMVATAVGNLIGGKLADKNADPSKFFMRLIIAAVWLALIPLVGKYVIAGVAMLLALFVKSGFLIVASLISCIILFVFPLILLATTTPSLVKYTMTSLEDSGKTVGRLGALNTLGCIIGTFTPTFITIPLIGTAWTFIVFSAILFILGASYFVSVLIGGEKNYKDIITISVSFVLIVVSAVLSSLSGFAFWESNLVYENESEYNYIKVAETENTISLSTNVLFGEQSVKNKNSTLTKYYYDYALAAGYMSDLSKKEDGKVLILGFGAGTFALQCRNYFPKAEIQGVEIDKKIVDVAYNYFGLDKNDEKLKCSVFDGRAYLSVGNGKNERYDVILCDAYQDVTIPFQMATKEFFVLTREHIADNGVMVLNLNLYSENDGSLNNYIQDTVSSVFPYVNMIEVGNNKVLFASLNENFINNFKNETENISDNFLQQTMFVVDEKLLINNYVGGDKILTDDKAPVEVLGMKLVDKMISRELDNIRNYLKEHSLWELFLEIT